ncbi:MAG: pyridine nucleotide-disulfide oxidoreductase [Spirochaetaceae bacterium]|nr:MAG: pyridine nucleotide-disulfide oxidoreductase [Spirochaetaceae bacterium]
MAANEWREIAASGDIVQGKPFPVELSDKDSVLLLRRGNTLFAWDNSCPHVGCPLSWGHVHGDQIICGCHNARFDIESGALLSAPAIDDLSAYEVREQDGTVYLGRRRQASIAMPAGSDGRTVVIVGAGAGGSAAAETLRREGFAGGIVMITAEDARPYDRTALSKYFLSGDASFDAVAMRPESFYKDLQIELRSGQRVTQIDPGSRTVTLQDGSRLSGDFLILASGATPKPLPVPGADLPGVFLLRSFADASALRHAAAEARRAVVIGASFIGTEAAAYLRGRGLEVSVVAPETVPFERVFGPEVGKRFVTMHQQAGVSLRLGTGVSRIVDNGAGREVELSDGSSLAADLVVVGIGVTPVVDYLEGSGLVEDGAVPVDRHLQTSAAGVYAVGDIARVASGTADKGAPERQQRIEHWAVAQRHGQEAARSIAGTGKGLAYAPFFWTRQLETSFGYLGYAPEFDATRIDGDVANGKFLIGYFKDDILKAVGTIGKGKSLIRYGLLLEQGRTISIKDFEAGLQD